MSPAWVFHKENAVLFYEEKHNHLVYQFSEDILSPFEKALRQHDEKAACSYVVGLVEKLRRFDGTLVSSVKNFFIRAYSCLYDFPDYTEARPSLMRNLLKR